MDITINRQEFGVTRTACSCNNCVIACEEMPGFLIPADLDRLGPSPESNESIEEWAKLHLVASPGASVLVEGQIVRIPTLVPAQAILWYGCHWLANGKCRVWENAPFGCAFFNICSVGAKDDALIAKGLIAIATDFSEQGPYSRIWELLWSTGRRTKSPEEKRKELARRL